MYLIYMLLKLSTKWLNDKNGPEKEYRGKLCNVKLVWYLTHHSGSSILTKSELSLSYWTSNSNHIYYLIFNFAEITMHRGRTNWTHNTTITVAQIHEGEEKNYWLAIFYVLLELCAKLSHKSRRLRVVLKVSGEKIWKGVNILTVWPFFKDDEKLDILKKFIHLCLPYSCPLEILYWFEGKYFLIVVILRHPMSSKSLFYLALPNWAQSYNKFKALI